MSGKKAAKRSPTSPEIEALGARIHYARTHRRMDKSEVEEAAGIGGGRLSRLEKGQRVAGITADAVIKIARALGVEPAWLLTGRGDVWVQERPAATGTTEAE